MRNVARTPAMLAVVLALGVVSPPSSPVEMPAVGPPPTTSESSVPPTSSQGTARPPRPNVVFVMVDDMRDDDLRYLPGTRHLLRERGVRFVNAFSPYSLCCPARASVLTGLYTHNHGVYDVELPWGFHAFDDRATLATMLHDAGYSTTYVGKYLNRYGVDPPPGQAVGTSLHYVPPGWTSWRASLDGGFAAGDPNKGSTYDYFDTTLRRNGAGFQPLEGRYQTRAYARIAGQVVRAEAERRRPFFLYLSFTAPHFGLPLEPDDPTTDPTGSGWTDWRTPARPDDVKGRWDARIHAAPGSSWHDPNPADKPRYLRHWPPLSPTDKSRLLELTRQRAEALTVVDGAVRRLVHALRQTGELSRTLIVFTSDNGFFLGEQGIRQGKIFPHEPSLRVPLLMRGPGLPAGATRRDPFTSIDFVPTLAQATGTRPDWRVDGVSLWDVARNGDGGWSRGILTETGPVAHPTPRDTDLAGKPGTGAPRDVRFLIGIRTPRYLYVDVARQRDELYDLARDPAEYRNLARNPRYARVLRLLRRALTQLRACKAAACAQPLPAALSTR